MAFTALERLLATERVRQRAARLGGFSVPALGERAVNPSDAPFLVTNMRGGFTQTHPSRDGVIRYGFSHVPVGHDDALLVELHRTLTARAPAPCTTVHEAMDRLGREGFDPHVIVVSPALLAEIVHEANIDEAWRAMRTRSEVATVMGVTVVLADLPARAGFVATLPALVGTYTRTGDHLGVVIQRAGQTLVEIS
jgi:hypothetical protein